MKKGLTFFIFILYTENSKGGEQMSNLINENVYDYLSSLNIPKSTRIILTDLDKTLFDTSLKASEYISKDLLKYLLLNIKVKNKQLIKKNMIKIFQKEELNSDTTSQLIPPIYNKQKNIKGCIILLNYSKSKLDKGSNGFLQTIRQNIEFFSNITDEEIIKKYENNPLYDKSYIRNITKIIDESIDNLFLDNNYKHIEELLYFKIYSLKNKVNFSEIELIDDILNLLEEKKQYYAMYAIALGLGFNKLI